MTREPRLAAISENEATATQPPPREKEQDDENLGASPLWQKEDESWELTWPIWHMLPRDERKSLAKKHGYKSIGEFEEFMSLQQAMDDSGLQQKPYDNELIYSTQQLQEQTRSKKSPSPPPLAIQEDRKQRAIMKPMTKEEEDDDDSSIEEEKEYNRQLSQQGSTTATDQNLYYEIAQLDRQIFTLHDELLHYVFSYLPVDAYATLALVSPSWKHLTRTESVYKRLCERLYLNQSKRRQLHVSRFGGSYQKMLEQRPRVKASGGCYVLKYNKVKKIQRDMWTEIAVGAILENVYYRYLYFQEDGRVLYALSSDPPHQMFPRFLRVCLNKLAIENDQAIVLGTFQVQKKLCTVVARQDWHTVKFELSIESDKLYGRFGTLILKSHFSSRSGCFEEWSNDLVGYEVPEGSFNFVKSQRL